MEKKTIAFDPSLLITSASGGSKQREKKALKQRRNTEKKKQLMQVKGDNVKELLLKKLKEYKKNKSKKQHVVSSQHKNINPDFMEKLRKKRNKTEQNISMGDFQFQQPDVKVETQPIVQLNHSIVSSAPNVSTVPMVSSIAPPPPYSNMKNTVKPTFRQWAHVEPIAAPPVVVVDKPKDSKVEVEIKKKFKVGKNKTEKKVGIFLKNNVIRRNVEDNKAKWKHTNLKTVKNYLKKHNLIRYGSNAPTELIREIYETTQMVGGIKNNNGSLLVDNFLQDQDE